MSPIRFTVLTVVAFSLTMPRVWADEKPAAMNPLEILEDCIKAAETGDFARYVDHLSTDEQKLQAGYLLYLVRVMPRSRDHGAATNPNAMLVGLTMRDLLQQHLVPESERKTAHRTAEMALAQLTYEAAGGGNAQDSGSVGKQLMKSAGILKDVRRFLVAACEELARPTSVSGEKAPQTVTFVDFAEIIRHAKSLKWTLYTRSTYAIALAVDPEQSPSQNPYLPRMAALPLTVEFRQIEGHWKITGLMPANLLPSRGVATVPAYGAPMARR